MAEKKKLTIYTSSLYLNNIHYIVSKELGDKRTHAIIGDLLEIIEVLSISGTNIKNAVNSDLKDFEDAIQHFVAVENNNIMAIITRNTKDYKKSQILVFNTKSFVKMVIEEG